MDLWLSAFAATQFFREHKAIGHAPGCASSVTIVVQDSHG
jgi:hypothetical protein